MTAPGPVGTMPAGSAPADRRAGASNGSDPSASGFADVLDQCAGSPSKSKSAGSKSKPARSAHDAAPGDTPTSQDTEDPQTIDLGLFGLNAFVAPQTQAPPDPKPAGTRQDDDSDAASDDHITNPAAAAKASAFALLKEAMARAGHAHAGRAQAGHAQATNQDAKSSAAGQVDDAAKIAADVDTSKSDTNALTNDASAPLTNDATAADAADTAALTATAATEPPSAAAQNAPAPKSPTGSPAKGLKAALAAAADPAAQTPSAGDPNTPPASAATQTATEHLARAIAAAQNGATESAEAPSGDAKKPATPSQTAHNPAAASPAAQTLPPVTAVSGGEVDARSGRRPFEPPSAPAAPAIVRAAAPMLAVPMTTQAVTTAFAAQMTAAQAVGPSTLDPVVAAELPQQIVQAVRMQWADGVGDARVKLQPGYLGDLTVSIRVEHGAVSASLQAATPEVRQWIETNQGALRQALADQGLRLDRLVVTEEATPQRSADEERQPRDQPKRETPRRRPQPADGKTFEVIV